MSFCILWFVFVFTAELAFQKNTWSEASHGFFLHAASKPASMKLMFKIHTLSSSPVCIPTESQPRRSRLLFPLFSVWIDHSQVWVNRRKTTSSSLKAHYLASPLLAKASSYLGFARAIGSQRPGKERGGVHLCSTGVSERSQTLVECATWIQDCAKAFRLIRGHFSCTCKSWVRTAGGKKVGSVRKGHDSRREKIWFEVKNLKSKIRSILTHSWTSFWQNSLHCSILANLFSSG